MTARDDWLQPAAIVHPGDVTDHASSSHRPPGASRSPSLPPADPTAAAHRASSHRPPAQTPARAAHDELLVGLGRRFRGATLKIDFELGTAIARQAFRRDFVYVSRQLHALEASRRVQGLDRKLLNDALIAVERHVDVVKTMLKQVGAEARALIEAHGQAEAHVEFTPPVRLQATIVSPYARAFVDLLRLVDETLTQLDRAWLLGLVDPTTKAQLAADCRKALQGFKEVVRQQRHVVGEQVREVNAARRIKRDEVPMSADTSRTHASRRPLADALEDAGAPMHSERAASTTSHRQLRDPHERRDLHERRDPQDGHESHASHAPQPRTGGAVDDNSPT